MFPQNYRVVFFNWASPENVSRLAPPKNASTGPPCFGKVLSMAAETGEIPNTFTEYFQYLWGATLDENMHQEKKNYPW